MTTYSPVQRAASLGKPLFVFERECIEQKMRELSVQFFGCKRTAVMPGVRADIVQENAAPG